MLKDARTSPLRQNPIAWLVALTVLHGLWYWALVHPWQAPDEYLHYEYLRLLDQERRLSLTVEDRSPAIQWEVAESLWLFQHYRYRLLPTPPEETFRTIRTPLGSVVFSIRPPLYFLVSMPIYWATASLPVLSQLYVLRLFSILLHALTVWLTYRLASVVFTDQASQRLALLAAGLVALHPQFTFIGAAFSDDNLAPPLATFALFALLRGLDRRGGFHWYVIAVLSGVLSVAAKRTAIAILPVLAAGLLLYGIRGLLAKALRHKMVGLALLAVGFGIFLGIAVLISAAPTLPVELARNLRLNPQVLGHLFSFLQEPARLLAVDWPGLSQRTIEGFWGQFGWTTIRLGPIWVRAMIWATGLLSLGCLVGVLRAVVSRQPIMDRRGLAAILILAFGLLLTILSIAAQYVVDPIWYQPQGRYMFAFIAPFAILAAWGWLAWWPRRWQGGAALLGLGCLLLLDTVSWVTIASYFYS